MALTFEIMSVGDQDDFWHDTSVLRRALMQDQPRIPSYYGYDDHGSVLFEKVTELPQYYLTRVEQDLLRTSATELADIISGCAVVELGSGSAKKTGEVLHALSKHAAPQFVPLDVSASMVQSSFETLSERIPNLRFTGVVGRYEETLPWLSLSSSVGRKCVMLLGSNLGNMLVYERHELLKLIIATLGMEDYIYVTADLAKSQMMLESAYNDPPTDRTFSDFRLNRLFHLNALYGSSFDAGRFYEYAHYNTGLQRIEAHLYSAEDQTVDLGRLDAELPLTKGSSIVVDYAIKFDITGLVAEMNMLGARQVTSWIDTRYRYGAFLFRRS